MLGRRTESSPDPMWDASAAGNPNNGWPELDLEDLLADEYDGTYNTTATSGNLRFEPDNEEVEQLLSHRSEGAAAGGGSVFSPTRSGFDLDGADGTNSSSSSRGAVACLYASHALARWAWRTWEFAVALILMELYPTSLLLVSVYGLLDNLTRLVLGPFVGTYIDRTDRLKGAISCYGVQNICIALSAASAGLLVWLKQHNPARLTQSVYWLLLSTTIVAGASSSVGSLGASVAVERQMPKVLCGSDSAALSKINSVMRAIDLSCQMLAPVAAGFLMTYASMLSAIIVLSVYCLAVWLPELLLLHAAYKRSHLLRQAKHPQHVPAAKPHPLAILLGCHGWGVYFSQSTLLAGLALALLYLTVLSLGFLMTSYLAWRGMSEATLSLFRAAGAMSGLGATLVFHPLHRCMGLTVSGCLGISWQLLCLLIGVLPVVMSHMMQWPNTSSARQLAVQLGAGNTTGSTTGSTAVLSGLLNGTGTAGVGVLAGAVGSNSSSNLQVLNSNFTVALAAVAGNTSTSTGDAAAAGAAAGAGGASALLHVLLAGLAASRFGLWLFDLVVSQLQQELVESHQLGTVSGVQASIQSFFEICSFIAGCIVHRPEQFHWLMVGSVCAVLTAAGLYLAFVCRGAGNVNGDAGPSRAGLAGVLPVSISSRSGAQQEYGRLETARHSTADSEAGG